MTKKLLLTFALLLTAVTGACAYFTPIAGDVWDETTKTLTVNSDPGANAYSGKTEIQHLVIASGVTSIGNYAFNGCSGLATVTVYAPSCTLGGFAFSGCNKLTNIYVFSDRVESYQAADNWSDYASKITAMTSVASGTCGKVNPEDVTWRLEGEERHYRLIISGTGAMADYVSFSDQPWKDYRSSIRKVVIGDGVTTIGDYAFYRCSRLTSINIPAGVTSIGSGAFSNCDGLTTVTFDGTSTLTSIGSGAFLDCFNLTSITIPSSVTTIGDSAFKGSGLTTVTFDGTSTLTTIGEYAFLDCSNLTSITIPSSVTTIGGGAFKGSGLTSITIPASVESIAWHVFAGCTNIATMTVDAGNPKYDSRNSCNAIIETSTNTLIAGCKNTIIPDDVTTISSFAFEDCTGLTSIEIPASVTESTI